MDSPQSKPVNQIRVGFSTRVANIVSYCEKLIKENNMRSLNLSAVGGSIGTLVIAVEVLKAMIPNLYQLNRFATISYQSVEDGGNVQNQRLYPKLEVTLSLDKPEKESEGYQEPLDEETRKQLLDIQSRGRDQRRNFRGRGRGRGRGRPRRGFIRRGFGFRGRRFIRGGRGFGRGFRGRGRNVRRGILRRGGPIRRGGPVLRGRGNRRRF